ncbi:MULTISPECIES: hypothetical protein [Ruegeria]|jgi:membrane protein YqaA with SNARE-associated domain|uniref:Uncharacterized protein n=1 Tax=Ruegeria atlantica TaxID=81569 RepID=A0A0P1F100_9RHOB|nr:MULTISPECIES: hypothetical protein [Ruegeria]CUH48592.1 hypothetical protein RUA4292_02775 [Ruegeria atlantica]
MDNTVLYFLVGIFVVGLVTLGYYSKSSGALISIVIVVGVLGAMVGYFGGYFGEPPK